GDLKICDDQGTGAPGNGDQIRHMVPMTKRDQYIIGLYALGIQIPGQGVPAYKRVKQKLFPSQIQLKTGMTKIYEFHRTAGLYSNSLASYKNTVPIWIFPPPIQIDGLSRRAPTGSAEASSPINRDYGPMEGSCPESFTFALDF